MAIEPRKGRWRVRLRLQGQPELSRTFVSKAAAETWQQQMIDAARAGKLADALAAEVTFRQALRSYADKVAPRHRGSTQELLRLKQLEASPLAHLSLSALSKRELRAMRDKRLKSVAGSTWNRDLSLITMVLRHAVREFDAKVDVRALVDGLRGQESPGRQGRISPADEAALIEAAGKVEPWGPALVKLSLALGTRRGELWSLEHRDVDRAAMSVHIRGTKTAAADRVLPISAATLQVIDSLPAHVSDPRLFWQAWHPDRFTYVWRTAAARAGLDIVLHLARHECLSRLAETAGGVDLLMLRAYSGHTNMRMLARYARPAALGLRDRVA